jgi:inosine-uridine nucleoside N-ribohydrolase
VAVVFSRDGLGGITERHPDLNVNIEASKTHQQLEISQVHGVNVALDIIRSYPPRSITYIVLGPMTNLARIMMKDGEMVRQRIGRIVCMGGALDVPGNTTPTAECGCLSPFFRARALTALQSITSQTLTP